VKKFLKVFGLAFLLILGAFAIFEHGSAEIKLSLLKRNGRWYITGLHVTSTQQDINAAFQNYRQLGRMTKYNVARSIAHVGVGFTSD
jgi:hypothetical protein